MRRLLKWIGLIVAGLVGLVVVAVGAVYLIVGLELSESHAVAGTDIAVPDAAADIAEGERRAQILGCNGGCHGKPGSHGALFFETPDGSRLVAPDLHRLAVEYSVADLERVIRHGVKPDGTTVLAAMPSPMFYHLDDRHLGQVIAYLRSKPPGTEPLPETWLGPMVRGLLFFFWHVEGWNPFAAQAIDHEKPRLTFDPEDPLTHGRYLAVTSCTECHGSNLEGASDGSAPNLAVAAAYSADDFAHLMKTGEPLGGRKLELMELVAKQRFAYFTDREVQDLHAYLVSRTAGAPTAAPDGASD